MGDFAVEGSELKKMVKLARKEPVSFAFNPGKSEEDAYCGMHRTKPASRPGPTTPPARSCWPHSTGSTATARAKRSRRLELDTEFGVAVA